MKNANDALQPLIAELDNVIAAAQAARLDETVALLRIARLDLTMRAHGIAVSELELVSFALARGLCADAPVTPQKARPKPAKRRTRRKKSQ